jgi:para-aminobenzoate synthetase component 2
VQGEAGNVSPITAKPRISPGLGVVRVDVRADEVPDSDVVLLDSRDSFTFNLAQCCAELGADVAVVDADDESVTDMVEACRRGRGPALVMIGPGPRGPRDLPRLQSVVAALFGVVPLFGVCLGLQVLVTARGGVVGRARAPVHGKRDAIVHDGVGCLRGLPSPLWVMRYHSLVATSVPPSFTVTARDAFGQPMALRDVDARVEAVQFHPESIGTAGGLQMLCSALVGAGLDVRLPPLRPGSVPEPASCGPGFGGAPTPHGPLIERQDTR